MHLSRFAPTAALSIALFAIVSSFATAADVQHNTAVQSPIDFRALRAQAVRAAPSNTQPAELFANPDRAYPASCLNAPLPNLLYQNDPNAQQKQITLPGDPITSDSNELSYTETDTVTIFRVPCAGGVSALLIEIDRPSGTSYPYPVFPGVAIGTGQYVPRLAADPNTFYSNIYAYDPLQVSSTYVFEGVYGATNNIDYNQAQTIDIYNLQSSTPTEFDIPAYNPSDYAAASQPLPISGYQSGNYYDPTRGGEGIQIEVGDTGTASSTRSITFAWYTFDSTGTPYWLYGNASFTTGDNQVDVPLYYGSGGGFAGNYTSVDFQQWGNITNLEFTDCNTVRFTYASNNGLPSGVPTGSGSKIWTRLTQLNGLTCQ